MTDTQHDGPPSRPDTIQDELWRNALRCHMRRRRAALDTASLETAARQVAQHLKQEVGTSRQLAGYLATNGELPVDPVLCMARACGANTCVPVVTGSSMQFVAMDEHTPMITNRFGIAEPASASAAVAITDLDLVLVPLLAFDPTGNRLGMGGGFYDRCFADVATRPTLVGVAHAFQQVAVLQAMPWDVALDAIVTEHGWTRPDHHRVAVHPLS